METIITGLSKDSYKWVNTGLQDNDRYKYARYHKCANKYGKFSGRVRTNWGVSAQIGHS